MDREMAVVPLALEKLTGAKKAAIRKTASKAGISVVQIWQNQKIQFDKFPIACEYLGQRCNRSTGQMQHVYNLDAREVWLLYALHTTRKSGAALSN